MPVESEMDNYMLQLGFKFNEVIERKENAGQVDKIYF